MTTKTIQQKYAELTALSATAQTAVQEAYRFARDNGLAYVPATPTWDAEDEQNPSFESSWDSSYC